MGNTSNTLPQYPRDQLNELLRLDVPDQELTRTLIEYGMPAKDAAAAVMNTGLRIFATSFYYDTRDAAKGDKAAKERVDYCRHIWNEAAKRAKERET